MSKKSQSSDFAYKITPVPAPAEPPQGDEGIAAHAHFDAAVEESRNQSTIYEGRESEPSGAPEGWYPGQDDGTFER